MSIDPLYFEKFERRHNAPSAEQIDEMLNVVKASSVDELISQTVPANIRLKKPLNLPPAQSEFAFLNDFKKTMGRNKLFQSYIGMGYYNWRSRMLRCWTKRQRQPRPFTWCMPPARHRRKMPTCFLWITTRFLKR